MKITPLEIRQKEFEKKLRGFDKDEVNAFLLSLSNEWERLLDENKELSIRLKQAEKEVGKLREVENSLFKTLKTAEQTGANVIDQANKAADLHMKETKMNAEALLTESKSKAQAMVEQAEVEARQIIDELQEAVKSIEQNYRNLETHRQNTLHELKNLSVTIIEKVELASKEIKDFNFEDYVKRVKALAKQSEIKITSEKTEIDKIASKLETSPLDLNEVVSKANQEKPDEVIKSYEQLKKEAPPVPAEPRVEQEPVANQEMTERNEANTEPQEEKPEARKVRRVERNRKAPVAEKKPPKVEKDDEVAPKKSAGTSSFFDELDLD